MVLLTAAAAQTPQPLDFARAHWIWSSPAMPRAESLACRKSFEVANPVFGRVAVTADARYELFVNGVRVGGDNAWADPEQWDISKLLRSGSNTLGVQVTGGAEHPGLLLACRVVDAAGQVLDLVSDETWRLAAQPVEGWASVDFDDRGWSAASSVGLYGAAPWGRLTRLSAAESQKALDEVKLSVPVETVPASAFDGKYVVPLVADRYDGYVGIDRETGRFRHGDRTMALLFVRYQQPGGRLNPADFDFTQFESDLALLADCRLQVALSGFGWSDLLHSDGTWRKLATPPRGNGLPAFEYAYQVVDYALDRIQAHGLYALALLDYRRPLPAETLPELYRDKVLAAESLWQGLVAGQQKIARRFAERPVLVGWAATTDGLPALPDPREPLTLELYRGYLQQRHGNIEGLRRAWGPAANYATFADVPPPGDSPTDPAAIDFHGCGQWLTVKRLNTWADGLRAAAPHQLVLVGSPDASRPVFLAPWLRCDLLGSFGVDGRGEPSAAMPGFGDTLGLVAGYRALPDSTIAGVLGGRAGGELRGGHAARALRHEWAEVVGSGAAGLVAAPTWDELLNRGGAAGAGDTVGVRQLGDLLAATTQTYVRRRPAVLVLRNPAVAYSNDAAPDARASARVAQALDQLHVDYDLLSPGALGGPDEKGKVELDGYQVVVVPSLRQLPRERFFEQLREWLNDPTASGQRALVLGAWVAQSEYFQPVAPPADLLAVTGGAVLLPATDNPAGLRLEVAGSSLPWPAGVPAGRVTAGSGGEVLGWLRGAAGTAAVPLLSQQVVAGNTVLVSGCDLGFGTLAETPDGLIAAIAGLLRPALTAAQVAGCYQADANVTVRWSADGRAALVRERLGSSSDFGWQSPATDPPLVWAGATTTVDAHGLATVKTSVAPYQVKLVTAVGELLGGQPATVRVGAPLSEPFGVQHSGGGQVRLRLEPGRDYRVSLPHGESSQVTAAPDGTVELAASGATVQYALLPPRLPDPAREPKQYLLVGDYYQQRGEFGRALAEFERLTQQYAGTAVAEAAAARRAAILADCGAVVVVNYTRLPARVRYVGPSVTEGEVLPGQSQTFVLYAGTYQEIRDLPDVALVAAAALPPQTFAVGKGQAVLREIGVFLAGQTNLLDPKANGRGLLGDAERQALLAAAQGTLPSAAGSAAGGAAGGGGAAAGAEQPGAPPAKFNIKVDTQEKRNKEPKQPTPFQIRNMTPYNIVITITRFVVGNAPESQELKLRPRGRLNFGLGSDGTFGISGKVVENGQDLTFGQFQATGHNYTSTVKELSAAELAKSAASKTGVVAGK
ncbi:MAG: beta-galactosidase [Phycisphaerales bacterium]|nr:beta-galactosidase [Phycisphaerales bacterium]